MKNNYPDSLTIQQYLDGLLNPEEMHELEKQALDDPFLWDALEGYRYSNDHTENLSFLQRQLHERIVHLQENKKVFDFTWQRLSVAAAAAVLFIAAGILFWMNSNPGTTKLANNNQQTEVTLTDIDSLYASEESVRAADSPEPESIPQTLEAEYRKEQIASAAKNNESLAAKARKEEVKLNKKQEAIARSSISSAVVDTAGNMAVAQSAEKPIVDSDLASRDAVAAKSSEARTAMSALRRIGDDNGMLSEVVIQLPDSLYSTPLMGWSHYKEYIKNEMKRPESPKALKGVVVIESFIDHNGKISRTRVIRALSPQYDAEALRLFKEGPKWTPSDKKQVKQIRLAIEF